MSDDAPIRRRFRFTLRTLFVVMTVVCCWLGYYLNWISQRREARIWLDMQVIGGSIGFQPKAPSDFPLMLRLLGEEQQQLVLMEYGPASLLRPVPVEYNRLVRRMESLFPEAVVLDMTLDFRKSGNSDVSTSDTD